MTFFLELSQESHLINLGSGIQESGNQRESHLVPQIQEQALLEGDREYAPPHHAHIHMKVGVGRRNLQARWG